MSDSKFKVGNFVKIHPDSGYYLDDDNLNPKDEIGTVVETDGCDYVSVSWKAGRNCYSDDDLELTSVPLQIETEPTDDLQSELTEAYAKIDTLESALEDAVRQLISLREGNNTAIIDVNQGEFKPISEMTLEDWELALHQDWLFEMNDYEIPVQVTQVDYRDTVYPVEFNYYMWRTLDGYEWADDKLDVAKNIIRRIR